MKVNVKESVADHITEKSAIPAQDEQEKYFSLFSQKTLKQQVNEKMK
jgi:hypothetical protein